MNDMMTVHEPNMSQTSYPNSKLPFFNEPLY